jgi:cytochrome c2
VGANVARFIRDEKRTYPFTWLAIGGIFAGASAWAVYAELVTRVPWEKQQDAFFEMERSQSKQALARADAEWKDKVEPALKQKIDRKAELEKSRESGAYADAKQRLDQLNKDFASAETNKTFGGSDLDEAYYHREESEYERDKAANEVRELYRAHFAAEDPQKGDKICDALYADPPALARAPETTEKMYHLRSEIARMEAHIKNIGEELSRAPTADIQKALRASERLEREVVEKIQVEVTHQQKVDVALAAMAKIDGPADPPAKGADERKTERDRACKGNEDTRSCLAWQKIEPVDVEIKALDLDISKQRRFLEDAKLRHEKAEQKADPKFDPADLIHSIVGPHQIQQVVLSWIDYDRDVDKEQVDRCQTCHMGADQGVYADAAISRQFRTHPWRSTLMNAHPIESFGCTSCHQGQGRATDSLSHSGWHMEEHNGEERWHFQGDHYWDDPLLPVGGLHRIIVDDADDTLEVKINVEPKLGRTKWAKVELDHRSPADHDKNADTPAAYEADAKDEGKRSDEAVFLGALQEKLQALVDGDDAIKARWHAVVRKLDNRVQIGVEQNDPTQVVPEKEIPVVLVKFPKLELAQVLGFKPIDNPEEHEARLSIQTATLPPSVPVRSDGMARLDKDGRYHPPNGAEGVQIPDDMRNRFIEALPEVESGCLKCHAGDVDLTSRTSEAKYIGSKLEREKAEAWLAKDPAGYKKAHDGADDLPRVAADPAAAVDPTPTLAEGRQLFRKLNCTGCHILDGYPWDRNSGPSLDNVTAKASPEWILTWIRYPRGWRAKTRMPNLWPKPLDPASKRPLPESSPEYAKWKASMREETVAIASFLVEHSDNPATRPGAPKDAQPLKQHIAGYADVPGATAEKGKVLFESYGCQGCHARVDADTADEKLPDPWRSRERDIAPTLANMGGKTSADWIAYWVEQPSRYWHGTKMPSLRLSREEAASVGKYVGSLKSKPLDAATADADDVKLVSDAQKRNEKVPCAQANGQLLSRVECGEKLIGYYGCFGCHTIAGFEKSSPIAPELGGFAKKDITTLDFGYAIPDHHGQTTETFATLKLDAPRIYRRDRIELRMADFDLSPREIRALVTFLKGLVNSKPKSAYAPEQHPEYAAALAGRALIEDYNCRACHVIEGHGADIDAQRQGQLAVDVQARAPYLNGEGMRVQPEWLFTFLRDPGKNGIRPFLHPEWAYGEGKVPDDKLTLRMPTFNFNEEQVTAIVRYFASWDGQEYPYEAARVNELTEKEKLYALTHMISTEDANCLSCHYQGQFPVDRGLSELGKMAPNLNTVARRLRPEWVKAWLLRPGNWLPYTKMTGFWATKDRPKEAALWPSETDPFASDTPDWHKVRGPEGVTSEQQAEMVRDFLFSLPPDAVFPKGGEEADSPLVKKMTPDQIKAAAEGAGNDKDKDKKDKDKKKNPRRAGALQGPARF